MGYIMKQIKENRRIVLNEQWHESGKNLPALYVKQPVNSRGQVVPIKSTGCHSVREFTEADYKQIAIKVSSLVKRPLQSLRVLDTFGRVVLVEFVPHFTIDPVLPVTFVPLGDDHDDAFCRLADLVMSWDPIHSRHQEWYLRCKAYARPCLVAAFNCLSRDEAEWYAREMMYTLANPDRRNINVPAMTAAEQREQTFIARNGRRPFYAWER